MRKIFKYPITLHEEFTVQMPFDAGVLKVMVQNDLPYFWAAVDLKHPLAPRKFRVVATGETIPDNWRLTYVDSFMMHDGKFVFHLFEVAGE